MSGEPPPPHPWFHPGHLEEKVLEGGEVGGDGSDVGDVGGGVDGEIGSSKGHGGRAIP